MNKLPEPFKTNWIKALRSGKFTQGAGFLYLGGAYCCLGVACIVAGITPEEIEGRGCIRKTSPIEPDYFKDLPDLLVGEDSMTPDAYTLAQMNDGVIGADGTKKSFEEIAEYIDKNL